jgi:hypothetical protein
LHLALTAVVTSLLLRIAATVIALLLRIPLLLLVVSYLLLLAAIVVACGAGAGARTGRVLVEVAGVSRVLVGRGRTSLSKMLD